MKTPIYQVMPDLHSDEYEELKADIAARGVQVAIEFDEDGNVLDGHHRLRACKELGITTYPKIVRKGMTEEEKRTHARKLNMARRHLTQEQRRELIQGQLKDTPEISDRQIAAGLGVHHTTVSKQRKDLESTGEISQLPTRVGADGKERVKPQKAPAPVKKITKQSEDSNVLNQDTLDAYTLMELDKYCKINNISRAEAIRRAVGDILVFPTGGEDFETYFNKIGFTLQLVTERLNLLNFMVPHLFEQMRDDSVLRNRCLSVLTEESEGIRIANTTWDKILQEARGPSEKK